MAFHVGQKVVCVDVDPNQSLPGSKWCPEEAPNVGGIYTIKAIFNSIRGPLMFDLFEIERSERSRSAYPHERIGYGAWRFRPLTDRKSEVSFTMGADPESKTWDNRRKQKERVQCATLA